MTGMPQSQSPAGHKFGPRRKSFDFESALARDWNDGNAFKTAWFNSMSMLFPLGEKFFIESVRNFKDQVSDPQLLAEIGGFQAQEATHRLQHQKYNELLCELRGYDLVRFEKNERARMEWANRELSDIRRLAGTVASEHLTAIMAHDMLTRKDTLTGADEQIASLWLWHGVEETEHKAVAIDVYLAVGGTVKVRRLAMIHSTIFFFKDTFRNLCIMLQLDGKLWSPRVWLSGLNFLFGKPGILRRMFVPWLGFFRKDFHPWQQDNRHLIDEWQRDQDRIQAATPQNG
jgi:hypothetical protein